MMRANRIPLELRLEPSLPQTPISVSELHRWNTTAARDDRIRVAQNALADNLADDVCQNREVATSDANSHVFSHRLDCWTATDQKASGRCWIFAGLNILRAEAIKNLKMKDLKLSATYIYFYDKLERSNLFLLQMIQFADEPLTDRVVAFLLSNVLGDGGQWPLFVNLVQKYGVVPESVFPETKSSTNSLSMLKLLRWKLKDGATSIRSLKSKGASQDEMNTARISCLREIHRLLTIHLGTPPTHVSWTYLSKNNIVEKVADITPLEFFKAYIDLPLNDYVCLIHDPRPESPKYRRFVVSLMGNVAGAAGVEYISVDMDLMQYTAMRMIVDGKPVMIGSEFARFIDRSKGIFHSKLYDYEKFFGTSFQMNKAERLQHFYGAATHAMALTGVNVVHDKPEKWRVENSHGTKSGKSGFYVMSKCWFDEWVYEVVVDKKYLTESALSAMQSPPHILPPWDPIGTLAFEKCDCCDGTLDASSKL